MAPSLTEPLPVTSHELVSQPSKSIFPDGIKTSGQHPPLYDQLRPFEDFPEEITGPTVWKAEDYVNNPERWVHEFTEEEIAKISKAADDFLSTRRPLTSITKVGILKAQEIHTQFDPGKLPAPSSSHVHGCHSIRAPQRQRIHSL